MRREEHPDIDQESSFFCAVRGDFVIVRLKLSQGGELTRKLEKGFQDDLRC
jgi:hypothetical protein